MTTMIERIGEDLTAAMKSREQLRVDVLRMAKTALTNREIEKRAPLDDPEALKVLHGLVRQREDSIEQFTRGGRSELAAREQAEIGVLRAYLPAEASDQDIAAAVEQAMGETGASTAKDVGKVMKAALAALKAAGKPVDGKRVNEVARARLS